MKIIKLTKGKVAKVDTDDYQLLNNFKWCADSIYASTRDPATKKKISMHRFLMGDTKGKQVDHIDGDGLNNQRKNLRLVTASQNQQNRGKPKNNSTGFKGVYFQKTSKKWYAQIQINKKHIHLGIFDSKENAHNAYCKASTIYHKIYAKPI
jgi:hypothetical protein